MIESTGLEGRDEGEAGEKGQGRLLERVTYGNYKQQTRKLLTPGPFVPYCGGLQHGGGPAPGRVGNA